MKKLSQFSLLFVFTFIFSNSLFAANPIWRPITAAELAMDKPQVEADADAEAIFWEVRLDDKKRSKLSYEHYVRVKIFTERGRERFAKFDIPFFKGKTVEDVAARVIKPDGTIIELQPQDIFEREIVKQRKIKVLAKSFAVPGIEPGVIVEYQYRETFKNDSLDGERLLFQRDIPIQKVSYYVRPYKNTSVQFKPRNMSMDNVKQMDDGFFVTSMDNVPAYKEEPRMPPDEETRRWVYLSYNSYGAGMSWRFLVQGLGAYFEKTTEPDKLIKQKTEQLTANASNDTEKLQRLYEFSQRNIKNISYESSAGVNVKIKKSSDVLKYGVGESQDIDFLFASLARAAGFSVNLVLSGDRSVNFFNPDRDPVNFSYVHPACIAIRVDGKWRYFNPGTAYLPFGELVWFEEGVYALLVNESGIVWTKTGISPPETSKGVSRGKFKLTEDGTLEGEVSVEYTGNWAIDRRRTGISDSPEKRIEDYKEDLKEWISTGEFSDVQIKNFATSDGLLNYSYKIRVPDYATKTGKRIFFQPAVFQYNSKPEFSSSTRVHPIYFRYPWSEVNEIEIQLPKDFELESFSVPDNVKEKSNLGELKYDLDFDKNTNILTYKRTFYFGNGNSIIFPAKSYTPLKQLFDLFHKSDTHTLSLRRK